MWRTWQLAATGIVALLAGVAVGLAAPEDEPATAFAGVTATSAAPLATTTSSARLASSTTSQPTVAQEYVRFSSSWSAELRDFADKAASMADLSGPNGAEAARVTADYSIRLVGAIDAAGPPPQRIAGQVAVLRQAILDIGETNVSLADCGMCLEALEDANLALRSFTDVLEELNALV
jgi:hypothetical protein